MQARGLFPTYHPAITMLFFVAAICFAFSTMQPVYVSLAALMSCLYLLFLRGPRKLGRMLAFMIPFVLFISLLNSLFNTAGTTVVWQWSIFSITKEGMIYGVFIGLMLMAVLTWFGCYSEVMTEDKFTYLFGQVAPALSLLISMISRWVPTMAYRGRTIYDSQECLIGQDQSKKGRIGRGIRMATVLAALGMEDSIQTSDSMRARGYGSSKRTSYAKFPWHAREVAALVFLIVLITLNVILVVSATVQFTYYPTLSHLVVWWGYIPYVVMLSLPFIVELEALGK